MSSGVLEIRTKIWHTLFKINSKEVRQIAKAIQAYHLRRSPMNVRGFSVNEGAIYGTSEASERKLFARINTARQLTAISGINKNTH